MNHSHYVKYKNITKKIPLAALIDILNSSKNKGTRITFKAQGASMSPFIKTGDILTIFLNDFEPSIGNIVAYIDNNQKRVLIHRIIARKGLKYTLKGDNCRFIDGIMSKESFAGYVESIQRQDKFIRTGLGKEKRLFALLSRSGLLFPILYFLRRLKKISGVYE